MNARPLIYFLLFTMLASCGKPEKIPVHEQDVIHVSFFMNTVLKDMRYPPYSLSQTFPGPHNFSLHNPNTGTSPYHGFTITFDGHVDTRTYLVKPGANIPVSLVYLDSNSFAYNLVEGHVNIRIADSANYEYKGDFEGKFLKGNLTDSFEAKKGDFYFKAF